MSYFICEYKRFFYYKCSEYQIGYDVLINRLYSTPSSFVITIKLKPIINRYSLNGLSVITLVNAMINNDKQDIQITEIIIMEIFFNCFFYFNKSNKKIPLLSK